MEMNNDIFTPDPHIPEPVVRRISPFLPLPKMKLPPRLPHPAADAKRMPLY